MNFNHIAVQIYSDVLELRLSSKGKPFFAQTGLENHEARYFDDLQEAIEWLKQSKFKSGTVKRRIIDAELGSTWRVVAKVG